MRFTFGSVLVVALAAATFVEAAPARGPPGGAAKGAAAKAAAAAKKAAAAKGAAAGKDKAGAGAGAGAAAASAAAASAAGGAADAATGTASAAASIRTRPCDQGDQSFAAGLQAAVVVGLGQQAAVQTLQGLLNGTGSAADAAASAASATDAASSASDASATDAADAAATDSAAGAVGAAAAGPAVGAAPKGKAGKRAAIANADFQTGVDRLNQFMMTIGFQIQMASAIADDDSVGQTQLQAITAAIPQQQKMIDSLTGTAADSATLATLLQSFQTTTGLSQDGANNAVIDCFLPTMTISG